jgi:flagellin
MRINTLHGHDLDSGHRSQASNDTPRVTGDDLEDIEAALRSAIANLQVSSQNVTASGSHVTDTEMSAEMSAYTENQMVRQAGSATSAPAGAAPRTILDLLQ